MMHFKKKYLKTRKLNGRPLPPSSIEITNVTSESINQLSVKNKSSLLITTEDFLVEAVCKEYDSVIHHFIYPDPTIAYLEVARIFLDSTIKNKDDLFAKSIHGKIDLTLLMHASYSFYANATTFCVSLFNALESFVNAEISKHPSEQVNSVMREVKIKEEKLKDVIFVDKVKKIIPRLRKQNFLERCSHKYEEINKLRKLRNQISHTKYLEDGKDNSAILLESLLSFNYEYTFIYCIDFMNFYNANYIEECDCGQP